MENATPVELTTVANDEVVIHRGSSVERFRDLPPDTQMTLGGFDLRTLPECGELLTTFTAVNDVHFGEESQPDTPPALRPDPSDGPYPEFMNAGAVSEMAQVDPSLVVVKGDLTSNGTEEEFERFLEVYQGAFGDRLMYARGNHESYNYLETSTPLVNESKLDGLTVALIDTSRDGRINGSVSADQLDWLDELGSRADQPVLIFGHHPVWDAAVDQRSDETFGLLPTDTEQLVEVVARRPQLLGYIAGHTHRNYRTFIPEAPEKVFAEVACVKDYPGSWAEYRVFDGCVLQIHRRISTPEALRWSERARNLFDGFYGPYAFGELKDRCFAFPTGR